MNKAPLLSVVVPLYNEEENVAPLVQAVRGALEGWRWELVLVDDGSTDGTVRAVAVEVARDPRVHLVRLARNYGQTAAMQAGFDASRGSIVVSMDGDLQNDPADIPRLVQELERGFDLVAGYRVRRRDRLLTRKVPSWIANRLIAAVTGVPIRDNGCSLKAYRRELLDRLHLYSDMHRFIPAVAAATAGARIAQLPVRHHPRRFGASKYGLSRVGKVAADLLAVKAVGSFRRRPLLLFAAAAMGALTIALLFAAMAAISFFTFVPEKAAAFVLPGASLLWFALACYLVMLGLIAEVAVRNREIVSPAEPALAREGPLP